MTTVNWNVRAGAYYDSVVLMQLQRGLLSLPGVIDAGVVMATQANQGMRTARNRSRTRCRSGRPRTR